MEKEQEGPIAQRSCDVPVRCDGFMGVSLARSAISRGYVLYVRGRMVAITPSGGYPHGIGAR
jgi:hypothetical protein